MTEHEAQVWEQRYATGAYQPRTWTSAFLAEWIPRIPAVGTALDVACGAGRNALALAAAGFETTAVDISETAIARGQQAAAERGLIINWQVADLDSLSIKPETFDLITCFRFRSESLWPRLTKALKPDGWLIAEHHFKTSRPVAGPPTDAFRLRPGEYLQAFRDLRIIHYSETIEEADRPGESYAIERVVAINGDPGF
ncbi:MAG: class I SAM-dependent methyltransferase [Acidimicrobiia bacterium]|nr:class I SAM-dependent methyltransferase [Acidimicrobiia bacterium]MDH5503950.1 class I SAM-dependent methyltransferase [Acidimicrobiia bacterium]